ncbi:MAG: aldehyde dehydrogenase family protein, partial [Pseudomonadota bacterium]
MINADIAPPVRDFLSQEHGLFIGGQWRPGPAFRDVVNPADGAVIGKIAEAGEGDVDQAVAAARTAFDDGRWSDMKPAARVEVIRKVADLIERHADTFATLETIDNGKPIKYSAYGDVPAAIGAFRYYAGWADK